MKKLTIILIPAGLIGFVILMAGFGGGDQKSSGGAPAGYTNSPADGKNCTQCMGGSALAVTDWITSNIPPTGYVPGTDYTITVTATGAGNKGFQVSPQDLAGNLIGTLTAGTGSELVGTKYVTHSAAQSANPFSWNFGWKAPATGAGNVTFYGSIAVGKLNTKTTTMTVAQSTVGMTEHEMKGLSVFPNPAKESMWVSFLLCQPQRVAVDLLNLDGAVVARLLDGSFPAGDHMERVSLVQPSGTYLCRMVAGEKASLKRLIILK